MDTEKISQALVDLLDLGVVDLSKYSTNISELIYALIELESIAKVSIYLDISENALEHVLHRKLRKFFPEKEKTEKWSCHLLRMLDLRRCPKCHEIKGFDLFYLDKSRFTGYSAYCASCDKSQSSTYRTDNKQKISAYGKSHYTANIAYYKDKAAHRRAQVILATPMWADRIKILEMYRSCPEGFHVDHIIPLNGDLVCGLHVEHNLQHLSAEENLKKSNKFTPG